MNKVRDARLCGVRLLLALGFALASAAGCGPRERAEPDRDGPADGKAAPPRIVCGTPAVAEIVFALGCGDRVVGVSDYTVYPPEAKAKRSIGGWINPNRERLLVVRPDLVISQGQHQRLATFAGEYGIRFHTVTLDTLADVYSAVDSIAGMLGVPQRGETLNAEIRRDLAAVRARAADTRSPRVFLLLGRTPGSLTGLSTVGAGTFLDDMIRVAGGTNVFADASGAYPQVSKESLLLRRPEVILEVHPGGLPDGTIALLRADWRELADLPAVRNDRIHYLTNDFLLIPGPRVGRVAETFADAIQSRDGADRVEQGDG